MIGNNACGARSLRYGRTADNVLALEVLTGSGQRFTAGRSRGERRRARRRTAAAGAELAALRAVVGGGLATIRTEFGRFGRQVSGYALEHLLPERGFDVRRVLVGSEGTLALTSATVRLVAAPARTALAVLGYPDMPTAADAVPGAAPLRRAPRGHGLPAGRRGARPARPGRGPDLPRGGGWLFVEITGDTRGGARRPPSWSPTAAASTAWWSPTRPGGRAVADPRGRRRPRRPDARRARPAYPGWEDSAVPPAVARPPTCASWTR